MTDNVAKNLLINVSIGNADRAHTIEEFYEAIRKVIPRKYNVVMMSGHYLVDGKVCRPQDYDPETQDFLPGRVGTAGGMTLGLAVSIGGVATPVLGTIAEHTSLRLALSTLIALALCSSLIDYALDEPA